MRQKTFKKVQLFVYIFSFYDLFAFSISKIWLHFQFQQFVYILVPFLQPGRLVSIKHGDKDFGFGSVVSFKKKSAKEKENPMEDCSYVIDVLIQVCLQFQRFVYIFINVLIQVCLHFQRFVYIFNDLFTFSTVCLHFNDLFTFPIQRFVYIFRCLKKHQKVKIL